MSQIRSIRGGYSPLTVKYEELGRLVKVERGSQLKSIDRTQGDYPVVTAGRENSGTHGSFNHDSDSVTISTHGAYAGHVAFWPHRIWLANNVFLLKPIADTVVPRYLFFVLKNTQPQIEGRVRSGGIPYLTFQDIATIKIPIPSVGIQQEIVRILDKFTQLEAELEAELEARQKQYAHYRKQLINEVTIEGEWVKLGDVLENFDRLRRPVTRAARKHGPYPYYGANGIQDYVDQYLFDGTFLLMGEDGSVSREDGSPVLSWASGKFWVNNHAHVLHARDERILLRFAYHFLQTVDITRYVTGSAQPKLNQKNMNAIPIVIPRLEAQEYVVRVLDNFDVITTGLSSGLPAEILARRRQYEFYRDRLLTFKELAV